tara:strand:- start:155 stop:745 length:591 start_codon:yes stop_codon:yes gene_type:complete
MTNTVSLKTDHLGSDKPYVVGHQYSVVGQCTISAYRTGTTATAASQTITSTTSPDIYTRTAGDFTTDGFQVGDMVCVLGSHADNNDNVDRVTTLTALVMGVDATMAAGGAGVGGGNETITHAGEKILASSFGLTTVSSVELVGQSSSEENWLINTIAADGSYFHVVCMTTGSAGALLASMPTGALPPLSLRVSGNI